MDDYQILYVDVIGLTYYLGYIKVGIHLDARLLGMRTPPLLLLLLVPLLLASSKWTWSSPWRTPTWPATYTDDSDNGRNRAISAKNRKNPAFNRIQRVLEFLSSNSWKNGRVPVSPTGVSTLETQLLNSKDKQDSGQSLANHLPSSLLLFKSWRQLQKKDMVEEQNEEGGSTREKINVTF